jgi:hypothetical protein
MSVAGGRASSTNHGPSANGTCADGPCDSVCDAGDRKAGRHSIWATVATAARATAADERPTASRTLGAMIAGQ